MKFSTDIFYLSLCREFSDLSLGDDEGKSEDIEELDSSSSITTTLELKFSLCKTSTATGIGRNCFPSASAVAAVASENPILTEVNTGLHQVNHVAEVAATDVEMSVMSIDAPAIYDIEQRSSVPVGPHATPKKCSNWYCPHGKSPFQVTCLVILYLALGVIFFPLLVIVFMICCVSYFTPDID